jgi:hypothetical protein
MRKTLLFVAFSSAAVLTLILAGCSKKSDTPALTMKNVAGTYKTTALTGAVGGFTINLYDSLDACRKDDNYKFNADSTYQYIDAGTQCSPPANSEGTWVISGNYIILDGNDTATVKSFNGSQLVVNYTDNSMGITFIATQTFTKL